MVYIVNNVWYPTDKSNEVANKYFEVLKKFPPDPSLGKTILILVRSTKEGIHVIGIEKPAEGKCEENIIRTTQGNEIMASIDGLTYQIDTYMDYTEAYKVLGMTAPENI